MAQKGLRPALLVAVAALGAGIAAPARADQNHFGFLEPGNLLVSRSVYGGTTDLLTPGTTVLPPGCTSSCAKANADGSYPTVFNNDIIDPSFGITSKIFLDQLTPWGARVNSLEVPNSADPGVSGRSDQLVTSFSSKSELALNLSLRGRAVTFMGYEAPVNAIDVSNSNTPGVIDPTNPVSSASYRAVASLNQAGHFHFTLTNAYSGNNGRAAILNDEPGAHVDYTAGNAGNGGNPQPTGVILGAGAQIVAPTLAPEAAQSPGTPMPVGSFNISQLGVPADKVGKDTNFRGMTVFDNVLYYTKGSGGNGVNTVYFVDTTGTACPNGVGLPQPGAQLPTSAIAYNALTLQSQGVQPTNMCILKGFNTALAKKTTDVFPFGLWFANDHTLYVADEGSGDNTFSRWRLHERRFADEGRPPEVGARRLDPYVEARLHDPKRAEPRPAVHDPGLPDRQQPGHRPAVVAGHRRPAQHHRPRGSRRLRDDLGDHLDRQRQRRPGRRPEQARCGHRSAQRRHAAGG